MRPDLLLANRLQYYQTVYRIKSGMLNNYLFSFAIMNRSSTVFMMN